MKSESNSVTILPDAIIDKIASLGLTHSRYSKAIKILSLILRNKNREKLKLEDYVAIPSTYWVKAVGTRYDLTMKILIQYGIVQDTHYSWYQSQSKSYRINPDFITGAISKVNFKSRRESSGKSPECRSTVRFLRSLRIDVRKAKAVTEQYISSGAYCENISIDPEINPSTIIGVHPRNTGYQKKKFFSLSTWRKIADSKGLVIIQDGADFYIDDPKRFLIEKEFDIRLSYLDMIYRYQNREFFASRNNTNHRLDSNLSSFPSILLQCFKFKGEPLVSIDLSNSQFVMFAKLVESGFLHSIFNFPQPIPHMYYSEQYIDSYNTTQSEPELKFGMAEDPIMTEDMIEFIKLAKNGTLYEYVQVQLGLSPGEAGRRQAKQMMFRICFSGRRDNSESKQLLIGIFPSVIDIMDQVKAKYRDNDFAILLQMMESRIFIDLVKSELDRRGFDTATKHDSVLCPVRQLPEVEATIREILDRELGVYQLKVDVLE